ncbi:Protein CBG01772 [Caenorhabditis briggsae]|uniref:Protein CBG01772 n=3 Tax=Caenorhabditis briggsae TaxID=6238 RepID=A8WQV6_CAEBR|nr:Protein CBG01772 [Caenorhabditis briggsae]ULT96290.1 hypothetical protein L3Y34_004716 [Caenorhabditis briggsae]CAP22864.1 Protein CBG01772 [Caenorhabditis briggsae]
MIRVVSCVFVLTTSIVTSQPLLFPHGWFESKNLRPRDAIMLNMMAQSNLEYGGVTLEELDKLDAVRKQIPRPEKLARDREEDDVELDRQPAFTAEGEKIENEEKKETDDPEIGNDLKKKAPFRRVQLKLQKKRSTEAEPTKDSANPFEEIATRSPPRDRMTMRQLRNRNRKHRKKMARYRKNGFLTRDDIIKSKASTQSNVKITDRTYEKAEFDEKLRNHAQDTWERENKAAEKVREDMAAGRKEEIEPEPISPAMKLLAKEHSDIDRRIAIAEQTMPRKVDRLPNNPYSNVDLRKPTVLTLPLPPLDKLKEEVQ